MKRCTNTETVNNFRSLDSVLQYYTSYLSKQKIYIDILIYYDFFHLFQILKGVMQKVIKISVTVKKYRLYLFYLTMKNFFYTANY